MGEEAKTHQHSPSAKTRYATSPMPILAQYSGDATAPRLPSGALSLDPLPNLRPPNLIALSSQVHSPYSKILTTGLAIRQACSHFL
jgi:hypothetical protein